MYIYKQKMCWCFCSYTSSELPFSETDAEPRPSRAWSDMFIDADMFSRSRQMILRPPFAATAVRVDSGSHSNSNSI